ncbi:MAG: hypothetical protein QM703_22845 [Gemmatales bacterium]
MKLVCPHCNKVIEVADKHGGKSTQCPECNGKLICPFAAPAGATQGATTYQYEVIPQSYEAKLERWKDEVRLKAKNKAEEDFIYRKAYDRRMDELKQEELEKQRHWREFTFPSQEEMEKFKANWTKEMETAWQERNFTKCETCGAKIPRNLFAGYYPYCGECLKKQKKGWW